MASQANTVNGLAWRFVESHSWDKETFGPTPGPPTIHFRGREHPVCGWWIQANITGPAPVPGQAPATGQHEVRTGIMLPCEPLVMVVDTTLPAWRSLLSRAVGGGIKYGPHWLFCEAAFWDPDLGPTPTPDPQMQMIDGRDLWGWWVKRAQPLFPAEEDPVPADHVDGEIGRTEFGRDVIGPQELFVESSSWDTDVHGPTPTQPPECVVFGGERLYGWWIQRAQPLSPAEAPAVPMEIDIDATQEDSASGDGGGDDGGASGDGGGGLQLGGVPGPAARPIYWPRGEGQVWPHGWGQIRIPRGTEPGETWFDDIQTNFHGWGQFPNRFWASLREDWEDGETFHRPPFAQLQPTEVLPANWPLGWGRFFPDRTAFLADPTARGGPDETGQALDGRSSSGGGSGAGGGGGRGGGGGAYYCDYPGKHRSPCIFSPMMEPLRHLCAGGGEDEPSSRHRARLITELLRPHSAVDGVGDGGDETGQAPVTVSYTHLTLPTKRIV